MFAFTDGDVWRPGIGDPTVMGWVTVVTYFFAAWLCLRQTIRALRETGAREKLFFWGTLTAFLVFLGINKQLDLQTLLTLTGRRLAIAQGWYENRRVAQTIFVVIIALGGIATAVVMKGLVRRHAELRWPMAGFLLLLVFVVVRAASFHHVDQLIDSRFAGVRMNWVLELGAITVLAMGAWKGARNNPAKVNGTEPPHSDGLLAAR